MHSQSLLNAEQLLDKCTNCKCISGDSSLMHGVMEITNYRISFISSNHQSYMHSIPLGSIQTLDTQHNHRSPKSFGILVNCKDMRSVTFIIPDACRGESLTNLIKTVLYPNLYRKSLFAYLFGGACLASNVYSTEGWNVYSPEEEYHRQNIVNNGWRLSKVNEEYRLCDTYPSILAVPANVTDALLTECAPHRSRGRVPVLSWLHPESRASLTRSSQPLVGVKNHRCEADELLIHHIRLANANAINLLIFDARPQISAVANKGRGGGIENPAFYKDVHYSFLNIQNIHSMRASQTKLAVACSLRSDNTNWFKSIHETKWLYHIQQILSAAAIAADRIENHKISILVHCSDGWDRTTQVTSLAMLMLDPYYRTLIGFQVLIEKEWISFGHKFCQRTGGPANGGNLVFPWVESEYTASLKATPTDSEERSPVFLQFIDGVWQMMQQFPTSFEFNDRLLITILDELYAAKFGTFLFDSERDSRDNCARSRTISLWSLVNANTPTYLNPTYTAAEVSGHRVLIPGYSVNQLELWKGYFLRWQPSMRCQEPIGLRGPHVLERMKRLKGARERKSVVPINPIAGVDAAIEIGGSTSPPRLCGVADAVPVRSTLYPRFPVSIHGSSENSISVRINP